MEENKKEMKQDELAKVAGGGSRPGEEYITDQDVEYCGGDYENGRHEWVKTGNHKEEPFFIFWTKGFDEYKCSKCGATKWEH
ncbi:MAG: hypothetical protein IJ773_00215 [Lachnospiraceae bacterium]|nr:hypothetical protein [Lachnospiraceae bacterium]